jgi:hypothetical protein
MGEPMKLPPLTREVPFDEITIRAVDGVTRLSFPASSEKPVERWFGDEVLSHADGAVRLDRAKRGAMPLLFNHNRDDAIGVIDGARVADGASRSTRTCSKPRARRRSARCSTAAFGTSPSDTAFTRSRRT